MTSSNRFLNRLVIVIAAVVLVATGVWGIALGLGADRRPEWLDGSFAWLAQQAGWLSEPQIDLGIFGVVTMWIPVIALVAVVLAVLLVVYISRRGRGATATVFARRDEAGVTSVDRNIAQQLLAQKVAERSDVLDAKTRVFRVSGAPAVDFAVTARRGAKLDEVIAAADERVAVWDSFVQPPTPVVVRITGPRLGDRLRSVQRVR